MKERAADERRPGWWWAYDWVFDAPGNVNAYGRLVYLALCRHASHGRDCYPSQPLLARATGLSERTVRRALEVLVQAGWITREARTTDDGDRTSNRYHLVDPAPQARGGVSQAPPPGLSGPTPPVCGAGEVLQASEGRPTEGLLFGLRRPKPDVTPFHAFWSGYPKKRHKPAARRAWDAVKGDAHVAAIAVGLLAWKGSDAWARGFVEDPATFLRQRQWEDTPDARIEQTAAERAAEIAAALKGNA